jgi:hypothetical protein
MVTSLRRIKGKLGYFQKNGTDSIFQHKWSFIIVW